LILRHIAEFLEHGDTLGLRVGSMDGRGVYQNLLADCYRAGVDTSCLTVADMTQVLVWHKVQQKRFTNQFNEKWELHGNDIAPNSPTMDAVSVTSSALPLILAMADVVVADRHIKKLLREGYFSGQDYKNKYSSRRRDLMPSACSTSILGAGNNSFFQNSNENNSNPPSPASSVGSGDSSSNV
jgi:hypothetical protein